LKPNDEAGPWKFQMPFEIERKFLLAADSWRKITHRREKLVDGLVAATEGRKVRVRIYEGKATLTVKGPKNGLTRAEFEYEIPRADAAEMIARHCGDKVIVKNRHYLEHRGFAWQVDEYGGLLEGVVIAEVELVSENQEVPLPEWVGEEITHDPDYRKINLLNARLARIARSDVALGFAFSASHDA
jgi:adenylate cyclase